MTRALYVIGGPGVGKSTFSAEVFAGVQFGPLEDLHSCQNSRGSTIVLRGHRFRGDGVYLGVQRDEFPGSDGLDRVSYLPGREWAVGGGLPALIYGEGATLAEREFLRLLDQSTNLTVVHLYADPMIQDLRLLGRGASQNASWVQSKTTQMRNTADRLTKTGAKVYHVDTAEPEEWWSAVEFCRGALLLGNATVD